MTPSRNNKYYKKFREQGICVTCTNAPVVIGKSMCVNCLILKRESTAKWRRNNLQSFRGLTQEQYIHELEIRGATLIDRVGRCDICQEFYPLEIDHDHETGTYRGMVCANCNKMLGLGKDSYWTFISAADYIKQYELRSENIGITT